jgi:hypothetical protein
MRTALRADARTLHEIHVSQAPNEVPGHVPRMWPHLERSVQWRNDEGARILHRLRHGEAFDRGGHAKEVLRALQQAKESLDGLVESAGLLWTWQYLLQVATSRRCRYHDIRTTIVLC